MSNDTRKKGAPDPTRIDLRQDQDVLDWAKKFGVTREQLLAAVAYVGNAAASVERHLKRR